MNKAICSVTVAPVRKEPSEKVEMVSQILFGESCDILEEQKHWTKIKMHYDDYEGWIDAKQLKHVDDNFLTNRKVTMITENFSSVMMKDGRTLLYCLNRLSCKKTWLKPLLNFFYLPYITHNKSVVTGTPKYNYRVGLIFEILKDLEKIMIKQECGVKQAIQTLVKIKESEEELLIH